MKKKVNVILILVAIFTLMISVLLIKSFLSKEITVKTEIEAINIAEKYVSEKYGDEFSDYTIKATLEGDIWIVSYSKNEKDKEIFTLGGGGPAVKIKRSDGKVISCLLQK